MELKFWVLFMCHKLGIYATLCTKIFLVFFSVSCYLKVMVIFYLCLQVASLLPEEAFTVVRKSFDARKVSSALMFYKLVLQFLCADNNS